MGVVMGLGMEQSKAGTEELMAPELAGVDSGAYGYPRTSARSANPAAAKSAPRSELFRYRVFKRLMDVALIALASPILVPLLLALALAVRLTSPGPILFSHRRICKSGAFFSMWKFRTMCVNGTEVLERYLAEHPEARQEWNRTHKLRFDPRVTPIGRLLRKLSLDELPQVWNVITGRMSLVGPRPIVAAEVEKYGACFDCYTSVKPGLTGLWQVSGRSTLSYEQRVKLDCEYARRWSLLGDLRILAVTLRAVIDQEGAY
jgi:lipopolysaccharide/colanic/teichoic acid biosynthesis glycosyltransferase